jgi:hypothetical protein
VTSPDEELQNHDHLFILKGAKNIGPLKCTVSVQDKNGHAVINLIDITRADGEKILDVGRQVRNNKLIQQDLNPREIIDDHQRIIRILSALSTHGCECWIRPVDREAPAQSGYLSPDLRLMHEVSQAPVSVPFYVYLVSRFSLFRYRVDNYSDIIEVPQSLIRFHRRQDRRALAPPGARLSIRHPIWPEIRVECELRDVSWNGLSIYGCRVEDYLFPGLQNCLLEIAWKGGPAIKLAGHVAHDTQGFFCGAQRELCGFRTVYLGDDSRETWQEAVSEILYRTTKIATTDFEETWDIFEGSGYFNISGKKSAEFEDLKRSYCLANLRLSEARGLGAQVVWVGPKRSEATVSFIKNWETAVFGSQLARHADGRPLRDASDEVLRDIISHAFEYLLRYPNILWVVGYVPDEVRFTRLFALDFTARYADGERAALTSFHAFQVPVLGSYGVSDYEVSEASDSECGDLLAYVRNNRPRAYAEATDLVPERLRLTRLRDEWRAAGLRRARRVLAARQDGRPVAFAVAEVAEEGIQLFGLLDCVRLFPGSDGGEDAFPALLDAARSWYAEHAKQRFILMDETSDQRVGSLGGLRSLGGAQASFMTADLIVDLLEYIREVTVQGPLYRAMNKGIY